jgi:hypothetical protein
MPVSRTLIRNTVLGALVATGALAASATAASADVVCNRFGECWRVHERYTNYPRNLGARFYDDAWWTRHQHNRRYHWREDRQDSRGYWRHNEWRSFR